MWTATTNLSTREVMMRVHIDCMDKTGEVLFHVQMQFICVLILCSHSVDPDKVANKTCYIYNQATT